MKPFGAPVLMLAVLLAGQVAYGQGPIADAGEFDGLVNSDMVETGPGGITTISFPTPFTTIEKPAFLVTVVLKGPANGLVEGVAIKAVEDIKGAAGNWTGFDLTVSKFSDGSSISDMTQVYVTWMAVSKTSPSAVPAVGGVGMVITLALLLAGGVAVFARMKRRAEA